MNYEQKYKEALERAKKHHDNPNASNVRKEWIEDIFPELRESEDEKIRKELIERFKWELKGAEEQDAAGCSRQKDIAMFKRGIAWLEKQGEQKTEIEYIYPKFRIGDVIEPIKPNGFYRPIRVLSIDKKTKSYYCESDDKKSFSSIPIRCEDEYKLVEQKPSWNEEDETILSGLISIVEGWYNTMSEEEKEYYGDCGYIDWLNSLKDRVQPHPKQEWSKDDKEMIRHIRCYLNEYGNWLSDKNEEKSKSIYKACDWLKSIKPNHWKPSEEQMKTLKFTANDYVMEETKKNLESLYNDLKNL